MIKFLRLFEQEGIEVRLLKLAATCGVFLTLFVAGAHAQKKNTKTPVKKAPSATKAAAPTLPPLDVRVAREKVEIQLANINTFVDRLGPIAQSIESLDTANATDKLRKETIDKNEENKQKVILAIRNLRTGISLLEAEFRTKTLLAKYLPTIQGITDLATQAEDSAIAGKFVASKEPLRNVSKKLTDTLAVMPVSPPA